MTSQDVLRYSGVVVLILATIAALAVYVIDAARGQPLDSTTTGLLSIVLGAASALAGGHQGATQTSAAATQGASIAAIATTAANAQSNGNGNGNGAH